jgi:hypothetical protein
VPLMSGSAASRALWLSWDRPAVGRRPAPAQHLPDADPRGVPVKDSRTSGDSRRRGKPSVERCSYCNQLTILVNSDLNRSNRGAEVVPPPETAAGDCGLDEKAAPLGSSNPADPVDELQAADLSSMAAAGPSAIESYGREPHGPLVRFEITGPDGVRVSFPIRCGLVATGGES